MPEPAAQSPDGDIFLITGVPASGKSTIAEALAQRTSRSVHLRGDIFRRFVINGRVEMSADPEPEAVQQLRLRYELSAHAARAYAAAGFTVFYQDVILGDFLGEVVELLRPARLHVVVLVPSIDEVERRERGRIKVAYRPGEYTAAQLAAGLESTTPRIGYWLDSSGLTVAETVEQIMANRAAARIRVR
ncbi:AAA family ATPase [Candidatus Poriferisodalis sp.]|uniref:AAA family ATPase n=1 Tax=Candidatus Poriferisodalis sp. TaxID=3101277 RepID=UPI003B59CA04